MTQPGWKQLRQSLCNRSLRESDIQGIFGVGASVGEARALDLKFCPSLAAPRAHALVKHHAGPALKKLMPQFSCGSPLAVGNPSASAVGRRSLIPMPPNALPKARFHGPLMVIAQAPLDHCFVQSPPWASPESHLSTCWAVSLFYCRVLPLVFVLGSSPLLFTYGLERWG